MDIMSYLMGQNSAIKKGMKVEVVTELPDTGEPNVVYLVPKQSGQTGDLFDEYLYINNAWEHIGSANIDLSNYYTKSEVDNHINEITFILTLDFVYSTNAQLVDATNTQAASKFINDIYNYTTSNNTNSAFDVKIRNKQGHQGELQISGWKVYGDFSTQKTSYEIDGLYVRNYLYGLNNLNSTVQVTPMKVVIDGTWSNNVFTCTKVTFLENQSGAFKPENFAKVSDVLKKNNTTAYTPTGDYNPATKKYVDDNKGQTIQYSTMPTADSTTVGKVIQYIGTTDANYTNGYFYIGTSTTTTVDNEEVITYSWTNTNVQNGITYLTQDTDLREMPSGIYVNNRQDFNSITVRIGSSSGIPIPSNTVFSWQNNALTDLSITAPNPSMLTFLHVLNYNSDNPYLNVYWVRVVTENNIRYNGAVSNLDNFSINKIVQTTGNQGIYGVKTFYNKALCHLPPSDNSDLVNKKYVDDAISSAIGNVLGGSA